MLLLNFKTVIPSAFQNPEDQDIQNNNSVTFCMAVKQSLILREEHKHTWKQSAQENTST